MAVYRQFILPDSFACYVSGHISIYIYIYIYIHAQLIKLKTFKCLRLGVLHKK